MPGQNSGPQAALTGDQLVALRCRGDRVAACDDALALRFERAGLCAGRRRRLVSFAGLAAAAGDSVRGSGRTTIGCTTPRCLIESASSCELFPLEDSSRLTTVDGDLVDGQLAQPALAAFAHFSARQPVLADEGRQPLAQRCLVLSHG